MRDYRKFYINGEWVDPIEPKSLEVINPANEQVCGHISLGSKADVDRAVAAAQAAFETFGFSPREERIALLERIVAEYKRRQAAPGVKVTRKNFGRDRRYPITNRFRDGGEALPAPDQTLVSRGSKASIDAFEG